MIDVNEPREAAFEWECFEKFTGKVVGELLARLESAEKERDWNIGQLEEAIEECTALRARIEEMERQEPDGWLRLYADGSSSKDFTDLPDVFERQRPLYALPGAKALLRVPDTVMAALDSLDDYIARIEGNDRGACNHINLLRRYLLDATDVGENK